MQDDSRETYNNMQADNEDKADEKINESHEDIIFPGPSISNWRKVVPNSLTALANAVGLSAMVLGMQGRFDLAVFCILAAGMLDGLDGPVARALNGTSKFGAEFDSLSDYVNFGVSPGVLLYHWSLKDQGWFGWAVCLCYIICMGCRLARFNAGVDFNASKVTRSFFMGVPAPAGAMLAVTPIVCSILFKDNNNIISSNFGISFSPNYWKNPSLLIPYTVFVAFLLVSRLPTFSSKMINKELIGKLNFIKMFLIGVISTSLIMICLAYPWFVLVGLSVGYIGSFPVSFIAFKTLTARERKQNQLLQQQQQAKSKSN